MSFISGYQPAGYTPDSITMRLLQECGPVCILILAYRFVSHADFVQYLFLEHTVELCIFYIKKKRGYEKPQMTKKQTTTSSTPPPPPPTQPHPHKKKKKKQTPPPPPPPPPTHTHMLRRKTHKQVMYDQGARQHHRPPSIQQLTTR